jgi:hypothetical protein
MLRQDRLNEESPLLPHGGSHDPPHQRRSDVQFVTTFSTGF